MAEDNSTYSTPKKWWPRFFETFAKTGIVSAAAQAARIDRTLVYVYKKAGDPEFLRLWEEAEAQGFAMLEDVATQRAMKSSDTLLIFLLKTRGPEKYGDKLTLDLDREIAGLLAQVAGKGEAGTEGPASASGDSGES